MSLKGLNRNRWFALYKSQLQFTLSSSFQDNSKLTSKHKKRRCLPLLHWLSRSIHHSVPSRLHVLQGDRGPSHPGQSCSSSFLHHKKKPESTSSFPQLPARRGYAASNGSNSLVCWVGYTMGRFSFRFF